MIIVKIGGSLITNKDGYCEPNMYEIQNYAKVIRKIWSRVEGKMILILGGGSFGNGVPIRFHLKNSSDGWKKQDLLMMTVKMFEWQTLFSMEFRSAGIPCYPLQTGAYMTSKRGELSEAFIEPIENLLGLGILPILAGDLVFDSDSTFCIYSSDNIPELFVDNFDVNRVVMLTDVPGVYSVDRVTKKPEWIRYVTSDNWKIVLGETGHSQKQDVTGGMKNKLISLLRLAEKGVESVICLGKPEQLESALFDDEPQGTIIKAW